MNGILLLLPVFLPLVLGLLSYFLPIRSESCRRLVYSLLILGTTALAWLAILLCDDGTFTLLHFSHRLTIAFRMDGAARLFAGLSATLWPFTMLYGFDYMRHEKHLHMFWAFFTASFGVTLGIAFSANMMTMYLFYELLTLATLPLVMQPMTKAAKKAGIKYLVYSISGAALAFIGLVFLAIHDAVDFTLGGHLAGYDGDMSMLLAVFALSFVGFGVKAAIWPLHGWLPSAAVAPTPVTALLHAVAVVKAGAFACIRLIYYSFGPDILSGTWAQQLALLLPIITIVYGSCMSLKQRHFKLRLAYSTVSNLSYILFAAALMTTQALAASFRRCGAALRPPGVRAPAGGPGPVYAGDLRLLHGGGLRPDGYPPLQRLCQQVVHRPGGGGYRRLAAAGGLRSSAGVGPADGGLHVPGGAEGLVPPDGGPGHSGGLRS